MERLRVAAHSTVLILVSLAAWAELWGIPPASVAVPIIATLTIVFSGFPATRPAAESTHGP